MYLPALTDRELLAHFEATRDPLTTTDIESEIAKRFDALLEAEEAREPLDEILAKHNFDDGDLADILEIIDEHYCDSPGVLRQKLKRADAFYDIANDAGDVIARLNDLINNTL